jgi:hypothetical protein
MTQSDLFPVPSPVSYQRHSLSSIQEAGTLKPGDAIRCIDAEASFNRLALNAIYTVVNLLDYAIDIGDGRFYSPERFERIEERKSQ